MVILSAAQLKLSRDDDVLCVSEGCRGERSRCFISIYNKTRMCSVRVKNNLCRQEAASLFGKILKQFMARKTSNTTRDMMNEQMPSGWRDIIATDHPTPRRAGSGELNDDLCQIPPTSLPKHAK